MDPKSMNTNINQEFTSLYTLDMTHISKQKLHISLDGEIHTTYKKDVSGAQGCNCNGCGRIISSTTKYRNFVQC